MDLKSPYDIRTTIAIPATNATDISDRVTKNSVTRRTPLAEESEMRPSIGALRTYSVPLHDAHRIMSLHKMDHLGARRRLEEGRIEAKGGDLNSSEKDAG